MKLRNADDKPKGLSLHDTALSLHDTALDDQIDRVAARLTQVDDDPMLAARIVAALPDRSPWRGWLLTSWAPRLAALALIVIGALVWSRASVTPATDAPLTVANAPLAPAGKAHPDGKGLADGNQLPDGNLPPGRNLPRGGHLLPPDENLIAASNADLEFGLPAIAAVAALDVDALAPADLPEDGPLTIESLEIEALPLTAEFSSR